MWTMAAGLSTIVAGYWWPLGEESSGAQGRRVRSIIGNAVGADRAHDDFHIDDAERPGSAGRVPVVGRAVGSRGGVGVAGGGGGGVGGRARAGGGGGRRPPAPPPRGGGGGGFLTACS